MQNLVAETRCTLDGKNGPKCEKTQDLFFLNFWTELILNNKLAKSILQNNERQFGKKA